MNIVSTMVGMSIAAAALPGVANMSIQPMIAQARVNNLAEAESKAVSFAALNEGAKSIQGDTPGGCVLSELWNNAYSIACEVGEGQFMQTATRSFRLMPETNDTGMAAEDNVRTFPYARPSSFSGTQCPTYDQWGVKNFNRKYAEALGGACIPQVAWTQTSYLFSNPDDWLFDINNFQGWGEHPDYALDITASCDGDYDYDNGHGNSDGYDCSNPASS